MSKGSFITAVATAAIVFGAFIALRYFYIRANAVDKAGDNQIVLVVGQRGASARQLAQAKKPVPKPIPVKQTPAPATGPASKGMVAQHGQPIQTSPVRPVQNASPVGPSSPNFLAYQAKPDEKPLSFDGGEQLTIDKPQKIIYEVAKGDRLDLIAYRFYGSHKKYNLLLQANPGLKPNALRPGTKLVVPGVQSPNENHSAIKVVSRNVKRSYVIKERDVLGAIAERELGSVKLLSVILDFNPGLNPNKLRAGQTIYLPIKKEAPLTL